MPTQVARTSRLVATLLSACLHFGCSDPSRPDPADGLWALREGGQARPVADEERVYFLTANNHVVAVDKESGREIWRSATEGTGNSPGDNLVLVGETVVAPVGALFGFDRSTGARRWRMQPPSGDTPGFAWITASDGLVFTGSPSGYAYAVDADDGALVWDTWLGAPERRVGAFNPVIHVGVVYIGIKDFTDATATRGGIAALDATTGEVVWRRDFLPEEPTRGSGSLGLPTILGPTLYASSDEGRIHALDLTTGEERWVAPRRLTPQDPGSPVQWDERWLVSAGGLVVASSITGYLTALDPSTGNVVWGEEMTNGGILSPIVSDGSVVFAVHVAGQLTAVDGATGTVLWDAGEWSSEGSGYTHAPAVEPDRLYLSGYFVLEALRR